MVSERLRLSPGRWYGWLMLPGYSERGGAPYRSPIHVTAVTPRKTGKGILGLTFRNVLYAQGVQDFDVDLRILTHHRDYLVGTLLYGEQGPHDRTAVISRISLEWIRQMCPGVNAKSRLEATVGSTSENVTAYLNDLFDQ